MVGLLLNSLSDILSRSCWNALLVAASQLFGAGRGHYLDGCLAALSIHYSI